MRALLIILTLVIQTPCLWAEINPYLDPSFQDYVETSHGYMTERGNFVQDLKDALGPEKVGTYPIFQARKADLAGFEKVSVPDNPPEVDAGLPRKSGIRPFSPAEKKKLLAGLNSFSAEEIKDIAAQVGRENTAGPDYRVHLAGKAGSLAFAVPPVKSGDCCLHVETASGFCDVHLSIQIPAGAEPRKFLDMILRKMNRDAGFVWKKTVDMFPQHLADSGSNSAPEITVVVSGNVPADGVGKLFECPFVTRIE